MLVCLVVEGVVALFVLVDVTEPVCLELVAVALPDLEAEAEVEAEEDVGTADVAGV